MTDDLDLDSVSSVNPILTSEIVFSDLTINPLENIDQIRAFREQKIKEIYQSLRPGQQQMADWNGGPLAISAVPGAGKSTGMAFAAALATARHQLHSQHQLVIVTFTRSAAANIRAKVSQELKEMRLPLGGFFVYTLHGLALNIALKNPELSGLNLENFTLILPTPSNRITRSCVEQWIAANPRHYQRLIEGVKFDGEETERLRRQSVLRTEVLPNLAWKVIQEAKSSGLQPQDLTNISEQIPDDYETLEIAAGLYENYQNILRSLNLIDYDEMILAALRVLDNPTVRQVWQNQVFAVFEDEAQDSTPLQSKLLRILASSSKSITDDLDTLNLVRVGDPNQAINSTFTTADPIYFRRFCNDCEQLKRLATMDQAGRSSCIIIDAANYMLSWVNRSKLAGNEQPFREQMIKLVGFSDHQSNANPPAYGRGLELWEMADIYQTVELIVQKIVTIIEDDPQGKFAILLRENKQGEFISNVFNHPQLYNIKISEDFKSKIRVYDASQQARNSQIPAEILSLFQFLDRPHSPDYLKLALKVLGDRNLIPNLDYNKIAIHPEEFLYPGPLDPPQSEEIRQCRYFCCQLLQASLELPPYQLISFLALSLQYEKTELATADKLSERIGQKTFGNHSMGTILDVLNDIVSSEKFEPVDIDQESTSKDSPYTREGQLTLITMHKAKGLDWDYVFIPFLQESTIPGSLRVLPQAKFLGEFTLSEVARAQIRAAAHGEELIPDIATAWEQAKDLKTAEEYRLLYVAMTRAKRFLWMSVSRFSPYSWHKPENQQEQKACPVFIALKQQFPQHFFEKF
jgi:DNA helicase-2/ATP-dependent DNA helicase PcrA